MLNASLNGLLLINKPKSVSSAFIVNNIKRKLINDYKLDKLNIPKIGHSGTLDPFATGLLMIFFGKATKLSTYYLNNQYKIYNAKLKFGIQTDTGDFTGKIINDTDFMPSKNDPIIDKTVYNFLTQKYYQVPPMYSAKKKNGKKLYELAREGIEVIREPLLKEIKSFKVLDYEPPYLKFEACVSSGTYIRTLGEDFAKSMNSLATLEELERTVVANYSIDKSIFYNDFMKSTDNDWTKINSWIPFEKILDQYPHYKLTTNQFFAFNNRTRDFLVKINSIEMYRETKLLPLFYGDRFVGLLGRCPFSKLLKADLFFEIPNFKVNII